ncbi:haeIIM [Symbiodinium sp. CCMP2592]|nr:haeIIM [Symbiodinium sp. CCMP2592]
MRQIERRDEATGESRVVTVVTPPAATRKRPADEDDEIDQNAHNFWTKYCRGEASATASSAAAAASSAAASTASPAELDPAIEASMIAELETQLMDDEPAPASATLEATVPTPTDDAVRAVGGDGNAAKGSGAADDETAGQGASKSACASVAAVAVAGHDTGNGAGSTDAAVGQDAGNVAGSAADAPVGQDASNVAGSAADAPVGQDASNVAGSAADAPAGQDARNDAGSAADAPAGQDTVNDAGSAADAPVGQDTGNDAGSAADAPVAEEGHDTGNVIVAESAEAVRERARVHEILYSSSAADVSNDDETHESEDGGEDYFSEPAGPDDNLNDEGYSSDGTDGLGTVVPTWVRWAKAS